MAYPQTVSFSYSYTGFQQSQGDNSFPGTQLDNDLVKLRDSVNATLNFLQTSLGSDGRLKTQTVGLSQLAFEIRSQLGSEALALVDAIASNIELSAIAGLDATDAQAAFAELASGKAAADHSHSASSIPLSAVAFLSASTVQAAIAELRALGPQTGDVQLMLNDTARSGWVMMNDGTIGKAGSGATTRANDDCEALYKHLYAKITNSWLPVTGGRGASADADWDASKTMALPRALGRAIAIGGSGAGLTARALGEYLGNETHTLTSAQVPATAVTVVITDPGHKHKAGAPNSIDGNSGPNSYLRPSASDSEDTSTDFTGITAAGTVQGSGQAHPIMQPASHWNAMVKL